MLSGVPQGSVLGPLLFILFINDLINSVPGSQILTFADDTKVVSSVRNVGDTLKLQDNLNKIINWSHSNNMMLNNEKFKLMCHRLSPETTHQQLFKELPFNQQFFSYQADDHDLYPSSNVRDLGVLIDCKLSWKDHLNHITSKARQVSGWVLSVFHSREKIPMITLFNSLVRSKLEYCDIIWSPYQNQDVYLIEKIQRSFTHKIRGMKDYSYWERLKILDIMSLQRRREKHIIIYLWKIKHNFLPNPVNITFKEHKRSQALKAVLKPLPRVRGRVLTTYEESFVIRSAKLWNVLPTPLTHISTLDKFKAALEKFLHTIPDEPPIPGYPCSSTNSLIDIRTQSVFC